MVPCELTNTGLELGAPVRIRVGASAEGRVVEDPGVQKLNIRELAPCVGR